MKTHLTRESAAKLKLSVEATSDEVAPALGRAVKALAEQVKVPGFRKGKVPRKLLETHVGRDALREATLREAIPELVGRAVETEAIQPIAPPAVEVTGYDLDSDLSFDATIEVRPEIELPPLTGIPVTRPSAEPTEDELVEQLARLQERFAKLETVQRPARTGDFALINIDGTIHGQKIDQLSGTDELYEVGTGYPVAELDQELEGRRAGEILKFNATLPETLGPEWGGKEVTFQVLVKEVREKILPGLDDELAKTASEYDSLEELKSDLRDRIRRAKEANADAEVRQRLLEVLLDEVEVDLPDSLVSTEMGYRLTRLEEQLRGAGMSIEGYLQASGVDEEQLEADLRRQAERNVRAQLILEEVARREEIKVTEDEIREEVRQTAEAFRQDPAVLAKQLTEGNRLLVLAGDIIRRKALNLLVESADITEEGSSTDRSGGSPPTEPE